MVSSRLCWRVRYLSFVMILTPNRKHCDLSVIEKNVSRRIVLRMMSALDIKMVRQVE